MTGTSSRSGSSPDPRNDGTTTVIGPREILACVGLGIGPEDAIAWLRRHHGVPTYKPFTGFGNADYAEGRAAHILADPRGWRARERLSNAPAPERVALPKCMACWDGPEAEHVG
jgi:hypothetical protein